MLLQNYVNQSNIYGITDGYHTFCNHRLELDEPIDFDRMSKAFNSVYSRFPYFQVTLQVENEELKLVPNTNKPYLHHFEYDEVLDYQKNDGFLYRFGVKDNALVLSFYHAMGDAACFAPFARALLIQYYGLTQPSQGEPFCIEDAVLPEETADPIAMIPDDTPDMPVPKDESFGLIPENKENIFYEYSFYADEKQLMGYAGTTDGSPYSVSSVLLAEALGETYPTLKDEGIKIGIIINTKKLLGVPLSYHPCLETSSFVYNTGRFNLPRELLFTCVRGKIIADTSPDILFPKLKEVVKFRNNLRKLPTLKEKRETILKVINHPNATAIISYLGIADYGEATPHVRGSYPIFDHITPTIEVAALNNKFYYTFSHRFRNDQYIKAFRRRLTEYGIACSEIKSHKINLPR